MGLHAPALDTCLAPFPPYSFPRPIVKNIPSNPVTHDLPQNQLQTQFYTTSRPLSNSAASHGAGFVHTLLRYLTTTLNKIYENKHTMSHLDLQPTLPSFSELIGSIPLSPSLRRCVADESHMPPSPRHAGPQGFERPYDDRKWGMLCKLATALCREELEDQSLYALLFKDPLPSPALVNHAPPNRSDIDVVLERLEDLINHPDPDISTVVRCVSEMLDNSVAPPYAQGWYKPMA